MKLGAFSISLVVKDLQASRDFYEALGFEAAGGVQDKGWLVMRNGSGTARFGPANDSGPDARPARRPQALATASLAGRRPAGCGDGRALDRLVRARPG